MRGAQVVEVIDPAARDKRLEALLHKYHGSRANRVLIFALYKKEAARLEALLARRGWKVRGPARAPWRAAAPSVCCMPGSPLRGRLPACVGRRAWSAGRACLAKTFLSKTKPLS